MKEIRFFKFSALRASGDGKRITGYAAVFKQLSEDLGGFREMVMPGAFDRCLRGAPDVRCLFNHDPNVVLGRTKSGTLRVSADSNGLRFECDIPDTQVARDVRESIKRGDIDQCSFGFVVNDQNWREEKGADGNRQTIRELTDVELFDVSPVTYAAYPQTSVSARLLWPEGEPAEVRSHKKADGPRTERPRPAPVAAFRGSAPSMASLVEREVMLNQIDRKLGLTDSEGNLEVGKMRQTRTMSALEKAEFRRFLQTGGHERRDLTAGGAAAPFIPEQFNAVVFETLKAYDAIFRDDVCTVIESDQGGPIDLFVIDDTASAATIVGEATADSEQDPGSSRIQLAQAPTWDTGTVRITWALLQDSGVDLESMLAKAFALRFGRGIGPSLISSLLSEAKLGLTAAGSSAITRADLCGLRASLDHAYLDSGRCWWLMNQATLNFIDELVDSVGQPVIPEIYLEGQRMLLGHPVGICPSLPNIGHSNIPIVFGATGYFAVRTVKGEGRMVRMGERYAEYAETGFKSFMRANAALLCAQGASSPVVYLQNS